MGMQMYKVIYDFDEGDDWGKSCLSEKFETREEAEEFIEQSKSNPYMFNFELVEPEF